MNQSLVTACSVYVLSLMGASPAFGQSWSDNFDTYAADSSLQDQGGWEVPFGSPFFAAFVVNFVAHSPPNSMQTIALTNVVRPLDASAGRWTFSTWQLIPARFLLAPTSLIVNTSFAPGDPSSVGVEFLGSPDETVIDAVRPGNPLPLVFDDWIELRVVIDLDRDQVETFYNGQMLSSGQWSITGGPVAIGAINVFSNGSVLFYDDFSLDQAAEAVGDLNGDGDVDGFDLAQLLAAWGACPTSGPCPADLDGNGVVDGVDLALLLGAWS